MIACLHYWCLHRNGFDSWKAKINVYGFWFLITTQQNRLAFSVRVIERQRERERDRERDATTTHRMIKEIYRNKKIIICLYEWMKGLRTYNLTDITLYFYETSFSSSLLMNTFPLTFFAGQSVPLPLVHSHPSIQRRVLKPLNLSSWGRLALNLN